MLARLALVATSLVLLAAAPVPSAGWGIDGLSDEVEEAAWTAWTCASAEGAASSDALAIIDYTKPSTDRRLWILDPTTGEVQLHEWVAHGQYTGGDRAERFSNRSGSHMSSLGVFRGAETYRGRHGRSLRLDGLDPGFNDKARERAIVVHGADYVSESFIEARGRLGRSWGCPAVRRPVADQVIDALSGGTLLVAYYSDPDWLEGSSWLSCDEASSSAERASAASSRVASTP